MVEMKARISWTSCSRLSAIKPRARVWAANRDARATRISVSLPGHPRRSRASIASSTTSWLAARAVPCSCSRFPSQVWSVRIEFATKSHTIRIASTAYHERRDRREKRRPATCPHQIVQPPVPPIGGTQEIPWTPANKVFTGMEPTVFDFVVPPAVTMTGSVHVVRVICTPKAQARNTTDPSGHPGCGVRFAGPACGLPTRRAVATAGPG